MGFLLDTNVFSELRKRERCNPRVWRWRQRVALEDIFTSVLVLGELRFGVEKLRPQDPMTAKALEKWLREIEAVFANRILPLVWGRMSVSSRLPDIDALIAATALHHRLTLVTRNTRDVKRSGADCFDPFVD